MSAGWLDSMGGAGQSAERAFGEAKGSGYPAKTAVSQSPLTCPRCGAACSGTVERKQCRRCGYDSGAPEKKTKPKLGVVEYPCPNCGAPLTILGDRKSCHACNYSAD